MAVRKFKNSMPSLPFSLKKPPLNFKKGKSRHFLVLKLFDEKEVSDKTVCLGEGCFLCFSVNVSGETAFFFCSSAYVHRQISASDYTDSPVSVQKRSPGWVYDQHCHPNQTALIKVSNVNPITNQWFGLTLDRQESVITGKQVNKSTHR